MLSLVSQRLNSTANPHAMATSAPLSIPVAAPTLWHLPEPSLTPSWAKATKAASTDKTCRTELNLLFERLDFAKSTEEKSFVRLPRLIVNDLGDTQKGK